MLLPGEGALAGALQTLLPQPQQRAEEPLSRRCPDGCPGAALPAAAGPAASPGQPPTPRAPSAAAPVPGRAQSRQQAAARRSRESRVPSMLGRSALAPAAAPGRRRGGPAAGAGREARGAAPAPGGAGRGVQLRPPHGRPGTAHLRPGTAHLRAGQRTLGPVSIRSRHPRFGSHRRRHHQLVPGTPGLGRTPLVQSDTGLGILRAGTPGSDKTPPVPSFSSENP